MGLVIVTKEFQSEKVSKASDNCSTGDAKRVGLLGYGMYWQNQWKEMLILQHARRRMIL